MSLRTAWQGRNFAVSILPVLKKLASPLGTPCFRTPQPPTFDQMKTTIFFAFHLLFLLHQNLCAQTTNTWRGGAPGHASDWHYYKNWSLGRVPDEFQRVVIPDVSSTTLRYPVLRSGEVEVNSLEIQPNASLTLTGSARLFTEKIDNRGACTGCEGRVLVEPDPDEAGFARN